MATVGVGVASGADVGVGAGDGEAGTVEEATRICAAVAVAVATDVGVGVGVAGGAVVRVAVGVGAAEDADPIASTTQDPSSPALATNVYTTPLMLEFAIAMITSEEAKRKRPLPEESTLKSDDVPG